MPEPSGHAARDDQQLRASTTPPGPAGPPRLGTASGPAGPACANDAVAMLLAGLDWLATADLASTPTAVQADCLRALERAQSVHAVARANALAAFCAQAGFEDDGHGSPRTWLTWQTRVTKPAASAALASMRRLAAHPGVAEALGEGAISVSWAQ